MLGALFFLSPSARAEDTDLDTVGRLGTAWSFGSLATLDQTSNANLVSSLGFVFTPALDLAIAPCWLMTLDSELRYLKFAAPEGINLLQDSNLTTSLTWGFHYRSRDFELGVLAGAGQSMLVSTPPNSSYVTVQNVLRPHIGGRLAYNGRVSKEFYYRVEGLYMADLSGVGDRGSLEMLRGTRYMLNTQWGFGSKTGNWLRFTAGFGLHRMETSIGAQQTILIEAGLSIGNLWGQRRPQAR